MRKGKHAPWTFALSWVLVLASLATVVVVPDAAAAAELRARIYINGNDAFTSTNGVVGGLGTPSDPFVIAEWEINASTGDGIFVINTDAFFVIRNVFVHSGGSLYDGIVLSNVSHGRVEDTIVEEGANGVRVEASADVAVVGSLLSRNGRGISSSSSTTVRIDGNTITGGSVGISLDATTDSEITGNVVSNSTVGIGLASSNRILVADNSLSDNEDGLSLTRSNFVTVAGNVFVSSGLSVFGNTLANYNSHTILEDNRVNGRPLYYIKDCDGVNVVGIPVGQVIVANCTDVRIADLDIASTTTGILLALVDDAVVEDNALSRTRYGISVEYATNASIVGNDVSSNGFGIRVWSSTDVIITENDVEGNGRGVHVVVSHRVVVYHNNFIDNWEQAAVVGASDVAWDGGYPNGGNYWSDYNGTDECSGPGQDVCPDPDGIGDTPYVFARSKDSYPLMGPYVPPAPSRLLPLLAVILLVGVAGASFLYLVRKRRNGASFPAGAEKAKERDEAPELPRPRRPPNEEP
jgi:parallel beta-helix repeat protein